MEEILIDYLRTHKGEKLEPDTDVLWRQRGDSKIRTEYDSK